ncbi:Alpha/Beta hydrolase protein [Pisolithus orientalis]|uniref:Alpha/Beta hydrolase protein n=1 Tax=Pisolithus orientalis TaxID=936130 RepID=UPI0022255C06|nr:Alpha/Beta hydrolase protein [Pisolithus orientalis]KAI6032828.1 Alpha/Beta hydrolase protein [Pisolithus orientalis]
MADHLLGRPSTSWKRTHVFLVILFWIWRLVAGNPGGPRVLWIRKLNKRLQRFSPWKIIVSTLTAVYAVRNLDKIVGLGSPEPLAHLYSPSYYRATWIATGLDAGFATAMSVRPKWLRDICSILFSSYYIIYANEGDEKLRRFRAVPTVEMFRTTWEKTANPYLRILSSAPNVAFCRRILLPRPPSSQYDRPITVHVYFSAPVLQLHKCTDLVLDFPGGGFVAMTPEHHEERLRTWALRTGKVVLAVDYGKAPEYPYPFAMDECFDLYRLLAETRGRCIGMSGNEFNVILSGDSAGAALVVGVMVKILQFNQSLPATSPSSARLELPAALVLSYAALDFNFTSWMSPDNLRVLRSEQSTGNLPGLRELASQKNHLRHVSPLSMVGGKRDSGSLAKRRGLKRGKSWRDALMDLAGNASSTEGMSEPLWSASESAEKDGHATAVAMKRKSSVRSFEVRTADETTRVIPVKEEDRPLEERVRYVYKECSQQEMDTMKKTCPQQHLHICLENQQEELSEAVQKANINAITLVTEGNDQGKGKGKELEPIGTRLTMTSRVGYFQDRIISPSMMRAMAILYIGPHRNPDFATDYFLSPILTPVALLAQFPPLLMQCGEKDPFVDDTVIFAGRVREAKRARKRELDWMLSGGGGVGAGSQMSHARGGDEVKSLQAERDRLARETEDDWVQMVLFKDWSHGYLQMMTLMKEARAVVEDLADWIEDAFVRFARKDRGASATSSVGVRTGDMVGQQEKSGLGVSEIPSSSRSPTKRATAADVDTPRAASSTGMSCSDSGHGKNGSARLNPNPFTSEGETDDSGITFVARKRLGSGGSGSSGGGGRRGSFDRRPRTPMSEPGERAKEVGVNGGERITEVELMRRRRLLGP